MTHIIKDHRMAPKQKPAQEEMEAANHDQDFDMAMEEDEDSEEDSSQDDGETSTPSSIASSSNATNNNNSSSNSKRPVTQALFLNFTSDLSPQKMSKKKSKPKKQTAYRVNGVNILNRNNLDSKTAIERIQRRRENHNHVERRRRDNINNTIFELSSVVPNAIQPGQKPNKGNILKLSLDYIRELQNENAALKERLSHFSSSRTSSISPPLTAATLTTAPIVASVDELNNANYHQSPSAPNSPRYMRSNTTFTQQSASVPSSPLQHLKEEGIMHTPVPNNLPPPLSLPPPQQQQPHQQQLQSVFSSMSVSSNPSSAASTPTLSNNNNNYPYSSYPSSVYIPQPPQLFNNSSNHVVAYNNSHNNINHHQHIQQQQQHNMDPTLKAHPQQSLRPLLPATKSPHPPAIQNHQTAFLPALRMSGYEKIYGNVCRY
ncbi:hypothetical protein HMPREF1544_04483 [Mucor circinelloides 1006PhL]|uniref:BHLH domain-containing protein n=1 Tax=Mucor circinelloides f. circinelloides (strain 1006PhL) TaxID=1220926 RepID=S2JFQ6_MUCC1|nr:hypothetical protein HMPREF1544_04483 [Mucor circinelloides 1006PhL]